MSWPQWFRKYFFNVFYGKKIKNWFLNPFFYIYLSGKLLGTPGVP